MLTEYEPFKNYSGVEDDQDAGNILDKYLESGYFKTFSTINEAKAFVGAAPVLTKMGTVKKEKTNPTTGKITVKTRIMVDSKESKTTSASR